MIEAHPEEFSGAFMSKYLSGKTGATRPDPVRVKLLADHLHVNVVWLLYGEGPVRRDGREGLTPFEQATQTAQNFGMREDAIQAAWEAHRDREGELSTLDWFEAIQTEGHRLHREGVPDPRVATEKRQAIRREKRKLADLEREVAAIRARIARAEERHVG